MVRLACLAFVICTINAVLSAEAETRVDLFDKNSNRTGSATIDERTGRIDTYDTQSNRTGYGTVDPRSGRIDLFDTRGSRIGNGTLAPGGGIRQERRQ